MTKLCFLLAIFIQIFSFNKIFVSCYKTNQTDRYIAQIVQDRISQYQNKTGKKITTISFYKDGKKGWGYSGISKLSPRAFDTDWSDLNSLILNTGRKFKKGKPNQQIKKYFSEKNWDVFSDDQLIFDGETLHFCIY